ncbi:MAG: hypothetical protein ABI882_20960 [Acidobacteriota bacterium]
MMSPEEQLAGFIAKFTPAIAKQTHAALAKMRTRLPGAIELVYDNYNALAIAFGPSERTSEAIFSIAVYPRWVSLFFVHGTTLPDPRKLLKGSGKTIRHIVLKDIDLLDSPSVKALMASALKQADIPIDKSRPNQLVIKSISAKQRPRRPA